MSQNRFWNLLAKKLSNDACPEELTELEQLMRKNPEWIYSAEHIENLWKLKSREQDEYDAELAFEQHINQFKEKGLSFPELATPADKEELPEWPRPVKRKKLVTISALVIFLLATVTFFWIYGISKEKPIQSILANSEVSTRLGSKSKLVLPDSTVVWLNAGSKLTYNENFGLHDRNTTLTGEAFFDVKKGNIPFIIHANGVQVRVMGTAFNVKSYPNERTTETSLIRGRVEITLDKRPGEKFILKPNEKLVVANEPQEERVKQVKTKPRSEPIVVLSSLTHTGDNTIIETSWVDNKLVFQDESFSEVARRMERWYNVTININDERIADMRLTGTFENENIRQALAALQMTTPFNFTIHQNNIIITQ